jgi:hypothetical protein
MRLQSTNLDYCRSNERGATAAPSAYEHLLLDCMRGDATFFAPADEVEAAWEIVDPVIEHWAAEKPADFPNYAAGSAGPAAADELMARDGRRWYDTAEQIGRGTSDQHHASASEHETPLRKGVIGTGLDLPWSKDRQ